LALILPLMQFSCKFLGESWVKVLWRPQAHLMCQHASFPVFCGGSTLFP
jgi:hypothetical protein